MHSPVRGSPSLLGGVGSLPSSLQRLLRRLVGLFQSVLPLEFCRMRSVEGRVHRTCDWLPRAASQAMVCVWAGSGCEFAFFPPDTEWMQEMSFGYKHQLRGASLSREILGVDRVLFTWPVHLFTHKHLSSQCPVPSVVLDTENEQWTRPSPFSPVASIVMLTVGWEIIND